MISDPSADPDSIAGHRPAPPPAARPGPAALLRDVGILVVVAWIVVAQLRTHVADRYRVETSSMEPTLHGDPDDGDVVLVAKLPMGRPDDWPGRYDVVVVRNRLVEDGPWLVKRLMVQGPADVTVREGDLWQRVADRPVFRRVEKDPVAQAHLLLTSFAAHGEATGYLAEDPSVWRSVGTDLVVRGVPEAELFAARTAAAHAARAEARSTLHPPRHLSTNRAQDSSFLDALGEPRGLGHAWPRDLGIEFLCTLESEATALHAVVEYLGTYHSVRLGTDGRGRLYRMGESWSEAFEHPPLPTGTPVRVLFLHLDGAFQVVVDEQQVHRRPAELAAQTDRVLRLPEPFRAPERNLLHLGFASTEPGREVARVHWLRAVQDPYLPDEDGRIWSLETGDLFLLGDNVHDSADSREIVGEPFALDDVVGRPWAIVGPAPRARWFGSSTAVR